MPDDDNNNTNPPASSDDDADTGFWQGDQTQAQGGTGAQFQLFMGAQQQVTLGAVHALVGGLNASTVLGANTGIVAGENFALNLLTTQEGHLGWKFDLCTAKTEAGELEDTLKGIRQDITGNSTAITGLNDTVAAQRSAIAAANTRVDGVADNVAAQRTMVDALETRCSASKMEAIANSVITAAEVAESVGSLTMLAMSETKVRTLASELDEVCDRVSSMNTEISGLKTMV